jgi:hypothetical protein
MPETHVVIYKEEDGTCPLIEWLDGLPPKAQDKTIVRIERLEPRKDMNSDDRKRHLSVTKYTSCGPPCKGSSIGCSIFSIRNNPLSRTDSSRKAAKCRRKK